MTIALPWRADYAVSWYAAQPWIVGCNFIPSTAINQLEMWQAETFDIETIDRELGWAAGIGFNAVRVYLHDLLWEADQNGLVARMNRYLDVAVRHGIRTIFTIFDDCWNTNPHLGPQPAPKTGIHNSGWVQSPGEAVVNDPAEWVRLERYVGGTIMAFREDQRILMWDLYNEPSNRGLGEASLPLLGLSYQWARSTGRSQPLTSGIWCSNEAITACQVANSDVLTFHNYNPAPDLEAQIAALRSYGRPLICTEYMARTRGSLFETCLPVFRREQVGCINWGLVAGKTNTIYAWGVPAPQGEPETWFHDIFRQDGTVYSEDEVALIRRLTSV